MFTATARLTLRAPFAHSLKEKRMVVKSLTDRVKTRFNAAIAEVDRQDAHQEIVLGLAVVSASGGAAQAALRQIVRYIEENTEAELIGIEENLI